MATISPADAAILRSLPAPYRALVIGSSGGIGSAFLDVLRSDPACGEAIGLSRSGDGLDLTDQASVAAAAERWTGGEAFDIILVATGALTIDGVGPEKTIRAIEAEAMAAQFRLNAIGPALVLRFFTPLLAKNRRSLMGFLSARVGSIGDNRLGGWISYRSAKSALNQIIHTAAIEVARNRPEAVVVGLHPGTVATGLSADFAAGRDRLTPDDSARRMLAVLDGLTPHQTGGFFAYDGQAIEW